MYNNFMMGLGFISCQLDKQTTKVIELYTLPCFHPFVLDLFQCDIPFEHKWKYFKFVTLYHILIHGRQMTNFEGFKILFQMLIKVKNVQRKHWNDPFSWGMVEVMHSVLLNATKATFAYVAYINNSVDEVMTIENSKCLSIHLYVVQAQIPTFVLKQLGSLPFLITYLLLCLMFVCILVAQDWKNWELSYDESNIF